MPIKIQLSRMLGERRMKMSELASKADVTRNTVNSLYHERAKGVTFEVMSKLCKTLNCTPGDLFEFVPDDE